MDIAQEQVVQLARDLLGVKWVHQGRSRVNGVDCAGLPALVGEELGLWKAEHVQYPRRPDGTFLTLFNDYLEPVKPADQQDGDILIFSQGMFPCHCGIRSTYYKQPGVVHAHAGLRKVVEQTIDSAKATVGNVVAAFRYPGVE